MKKILIALCLIVITGFSTLSFAETNQDSKVTASISEIASQGGAIYSTKEYQDQLEATNNRIDAYINKKFPVPTADQSASGGDVIIMSSGGKTLSVPLYKQELSYWCGPASTQMTVKYVKGVKYSQTTLAAKLAPIHPAHTSIK
jgi:hypothetical protein